MGIEEEIKLLSPDFTKRTLQAAKEAHNETEFRTKVARYIEEFAEKVKLTIPIREEYTLINGRADAVYNRLIIEYENPGTLKEKNSYRVNQHAITQVKDYAQALVRRERHKPERLAGVVLDGYHFIFVRFKAGIWQEDNPLRVEASSTEHFLKLLASLSTELALIPENLIRDFGENSFISRKVVSTFYRSLTETQNPKAKTLFEQWSLLFSEVCDYEKASKIKIESFARNFGITEERIDPFRFFFSLHSYYVTFIKLLTLQIVHYYTVSKSDADLKQAATFDKENLKSYFQEIEKGAIFKLLGLANFLEGDFFIWYLDLWEEKIYEALKSLLSKLADYSLLTLDVDPDTTRDLLKKLYQQLMPKELRHNLGEYYTPDWLAERLLNMLEAGKFEGNPDKRLLDPACGSGTFLVIAIKKIRQYAKEKKIPESQVLEKILSNVVGFDLNPLAVISARANYLLALGDLLQYRKGEINIPVYLCDSIMTPQEGKDLFGIEKVKFNTAVGPFIVPKSLVQAQYIDTLSNLLEETTPLNLNREQFIEKITPKFPLIPEKDKEPIDILCKLYEKLLNLQKQGINGIWARIIKNAFAPLFAGEFDYIAGNPPWVNWESLPENYRRELVPLWSEKYGLFPHKGFESILGKAKDDISILMTYVSLHKYLKSGGKLGFLITQSVFKTSGAGQGFRKFKLPDGKPIQVLHVDDMVELNPFEGASNRTSVIILQKGRPTKYPMPSYLYWKKIIKGKSIDLRSSLKDVMEITERKQFSAEPVNENDLTSSWITGRPRAIKGIKKVLGQSDYVAHAGVYSGGTNGVYWVDIINKRPDGLVVISNLTEGAKIKVESVQATIESNLLYPLLRGRDVKKWKAKPSAYILITHLPGMRLKAITEDEMKARYSKTYIYLKRFEGVLRKRAAFKRYFTKKDGGHIVETAPFYSMFDIGDYTFTPYKVVWPNIASKIVSAVISTKENKAILPQHIVTLVACESSKEAHYICALMNSKIVNFALQSYSMKGGKSFGDPHVLQNIRIPKFNPQNSLHLKLAELSERAHQAAEKDNQEEINKIEEKIDQCAANLWSLTDRELGDIKDSLKELNE